MKRLVIIKHMMKIDETTSYNKTHDERLMMLLVIIKHKMKD